MRISRVIMCGVIVAGAACGKGDAGKPDQDKARGGGGPSGYAERGKRSEAELQLNRLEKELKMHYAENAAFPDGSAPLTPPIACCAGPNHKCPADAAPWQQEPWASLDFSIDDPSYFQYSYQSDGQHVTATARGDLDCDDAAIEYTLIGTVVTGNPSFELRPPTGAD